MRTHTIIPLELTIAIDNTQRPQVPERGRWLDEILHGICSAYETPSIS